MNYLIKDTTREEREKIVEESLGNISVNCDGCSVGLAEMYQDYIDGKRNCGRSTWNLTPDISMGIWWKDRKTVA